MSSRLLILALTLVAVAIGGVNLWLTAPDAVRAVHNQLDGQLSRAAKALPSVIEASSERSLGLASAVAGNAAVQSALADAARKDGKPDQSLLDQVIGTADVSAAELGTREVRSLVVVATGTGAAVFRQGSGNEFAAESGVPLVKEALGGSRGSLLISIGDGIYRLAAVPVGAAGAPVGALALGFPVDDAFANSLREALGADVTVIAGGKVLATSLAAEERGLLPAAAAGAAHGAAFGFGVLPQETFSLFGVLPLPLFAEEARVQRAQSVRIAGLEGAEVIVSTPATAALAPLADGQKTNVLLTGVLLVVGLLFTGVARSRGGYESDDVEGLAEVAERAAGGDTTARAAEFLPGDLGRVARALNKLAARARPVAAVGASAADVATAATPERTPAEAIAERFPFGEDTAGPTAGPAFSSTPAFAAEPAFATPAEPAPAPEPSTLAERSGGPIPEASIGSAISLEGDPTAGPPPAPAPQPRSQTLAWEPPNQVQPGAAVLGNEVRQENDFAGLADAPQQRQPATPGPSAADAFASALQEVGQAQQPFNPEATIVAAVPEALLRATSRAAAPARPAAPAVDPDEAHFQAVYREFLTTRERCGEPVGGLTWEKFAAKLHKNREQLVAKYACRTVRFTVYVKDGKAALKAAPVRD